MEQQDHTEIIKLNQTMDEVIKPTLVRIETQTTRTNGNVRDLQKWRSFITGGLSVICIVLLPLIFMVVQNYFTSMENQNMIKNLQANVEQAK